MCHFTGVSGIQKHFRQVSVSTNQMKKILFLLLFLPLLSNSQSDTIDSFNQKIIINLCNYYNSKEVEKPIHLEWIQTDINIIKNKLNKLNGKIVYTNQILEILPNFFDGKCNCSSETFECGYNLKSTTFKIHGGYGSYDVSIIYFDNSVLKIRMTLDTDTEIINDYLLPEIKFSLNCLNGRLVYEKTFPENIKKYNSAYGKLFLESDDSNSKRKEAINYFTDVLTGSTFEKPFYILNGLGNETFNNLRYFIVVNDYDALENILFSPSPTSRQFAALTLRYLKQKNNYKPKLEVESRINETLLNPKLIESGVISCWVNKFDYDKYDVDKNFEQYLITE